MISPIFGQFILIFLLYDSDICNFLERLHAGAESTNVLAAGCSLCGVFKCSFLAEIKETCLSVTASLMSFTLYLCDVSLLCELLLLPFCSEPGCLLLHGAELHSDNQLCLCRHVLEHVSFQPPEHVGAEQVVELLDLVLLRNVGKLLQEAFQVAAQITGHKIQLQTHILTQTISVQTAQSLSICRSGEDVCCTGWQIAVKQRNTEREDLLEALRGEEVKQVEQLLQVVLKRSPSEQQLVVDLIPVENPEKLHIEQDI